jgi:hypothetical protein
MGEPLASQYLADVLVRLRGLKSRGGKAIAQIRDDAKLREKLDPESNSIEILVHHLAGNMISRWTDFLTADGEKNRDRDAEFEPRGSFSRAEILAEWERGWACVFRAVEALDAGDLARTVTIRGEPMPVVSAINRQLMHYGEHVGQILLLAKHFEWQSWKTLSIARGKSKE